MANAQHEDLFKKAINEALYNKFQRDIDACTDEIVYSERHERIMKEILAGKTPKECVQRSAKKKVIALLLAAALVLLAGGCAIAYREAIRAFISEVKEFFVELTFSEGEGESRHIEEVYELTYLPEGYELESHTAGRQIVRSIFKNPEGQTIKFVEQTLDGSSFTVDSEHSDNILLEIGAYTVYARKTTEEYYYLWNDGKYALQLYSTEELSEQAIGLIIEGITQK